MNQTSIIFLGLVLGTHFAQGFQSAPTAAIKPEPIRYATRPADWVLKENEPIRIKVVDGREATLKRSILKPDWLSIPFTIFENTCQPKNIGQKGGHFILALVVKVAVVWSTHPDPTKVGQVIRVRNEFDGSLNAMETNDLIPVSEFRRMPELQGLIEAEEIRMQDFSWIPEHHQTAAPDKLHITRWEGELMLNNGETMAPENRPYQGYAGVDLVKKSEQSLQIVRIQTPLTLFGRNAFPYGDVTTFSISNSKSELCQISNKIDQTTLLRDLRRIQGERQKTEDPLVYGVDSILALWVEQEAFQMSSIGPENFYNQTTQNQNGTISESFTLKDLQ